MSWVLRHTGHMITYEYSIYGRYAIENEAKGVRVTVWGWMRLEVCMRIMSENAISGKSEL